MLGKLIITLSLGLMFVACSKEEEKPKTPTTQTPVVQQPNGQIPNVGTPMTPSQNDLNAMSQQLSTMFAQLMNGNTANGQQNMNQIKQMLNNYISGQNGNQVINFGGQQVTLQQLQTWLNQYFQF